MRPIRSKFFPFAWRDGFDNYKYLNMYEEDRAKICIALHTFIILLFTGLGFLSPELWAGLAYTPFGAIVILSSVSDLRIYRNSRNYSSYYSHLDVIFELLLPWLRYRLRCWPKEIKEDKDDNESI